MADKRPFAKIDVSYPSNPKWFTIHRALQGAMQNADQNALQNAKRASMQAHFASILYCKRNLTDGLFPVAAIKAELDLFGDAEEAAITALFEVGLWINHPGGMAEVRDYLEHQTESAKVKDISEKRRDAALSRWEKEKTSDANSTANSTANSNTTSNAEKRREEERYMSGFSPDVFTLLDYLDTRVKETGFKKSNRTKTNLSEMKRLVDNDGHSPDEIRKVIDYATSGWWTGKIRSAQKLREKYDTLQAQMKQPTPASAPQPPQHSHVVIPEVGSPEWMERYGNQ